MLDLQEYIYLFKWKFQNYLIIWQKFVKVTKVLQYLVGKTDSTLFGPSKDLP
jgi:hypothetical protein